MPLRIQTLRALTPGTRVARFLPLLLACAAAGPALRAQQLIGYVNTRDADTTGASDLMDGQAVLTGSVGVTARDHTAPITLGRGGSVRVCQTSMLHLTESKGAAIPAPLLFSLDRGAIEIQTDSTPNDSIMTPDLRFTVHNAGPLDLRLRIARNGDTCVENRGSGAPTLAVSDPFGESMYEVAPNQHLLFEHGSLHEVVDNESSPCGCPDEKGMSLADALLAPPGSTLGPKTTSAPPPAPPAVPAAAPVIAAASPPPVMVAPAVAPPAAAVRPAPQPAAAVAPPVIHAATPEATQAVAQVAAAPVVHPIATPQPVAQPAVPAAAPVAIPAVTAAAPAVVPPAAAAAPVVPPTAAAAAPVTPPAPTPAEQAAAEQAAEQAIQQAAAEAAARAAALHPFPTAISEGLVPPAEEPAPASSQGPAQVTAGLSYSAPVPPAIDAPAAAPAAQAPAPPVSTPVKPAAAPPTHDLVHAIGHFFRKLFGG